MPPSEPRIAPRVLWMNARAELDFTTAETLGKQILARRPDDDLVRRSVARLFEVQGRADEALEHWRFLRDADVTDFEAAFHVARAAHGCGKDFQAAAFEGAPAATPAFRDSLVGALAEPVMALKGEFRHIAICGTAYCGSTLVDRLLGGLPGVRSIGESHWLTKVRLEDRYGDVVLSEPLENARWVPCTVCGKTCEALVPWFRRSLAADQSNWYRKIAAQLGTRFLISADKNLPKLVEKDPLLDMSGLVIFKSPEQAWSSHLVKLPKNLNAASYEAECTKYMDVWAKSYRAYLDHFRPQGSVVFLNFDAFTQNPEPLLRAVCERLGLPYDADVLCRTVPGHAIGGNAGSMRRLRDKDYAVHIESLPDPALDPLHRKIIACNEAVQQTWRELMALHETLVAVVAA